MVIYISTASICFAFLSAAAWLRASVVKVSTEKEAARRIAKAQKAGAKLGLGGASLDGWDMSGTFRVQSIWNAAGSLMAAFSISLQAIVLILQHV